MNRTTHLFFVFSQHHHTVSILEKEAISAIIERNNKRNGAAPMEQPNVTVIPSHRKTISLTIEWDLRVVMRVPLGTTRAEVRNILEEKQAWLQYHLELARQRQKDAAPPLTEAELRALTEQAKLVLPERAAYFAPLVGVTYGRITIRHQVSRWGSCSTKGNLNFNCLLMLCPPEAADYIVVHELCHRLEMNHSAEFWAHVARVMPEYGVHRRWLREHGAQLIGRLR